MKRSFITSLLAMAVACGAFAQAPSTADFNRAVLQAYEEMLREDPKDFETLLRRAQTYFQMQEYMRALEDLGQALKYVPATDKDNRFAIYAMRAECYMKLNRYSLALPEATEALKIEPASESMLNMRGKIEYDLGDYAASKADFTKLLRIQPRNQEAFFGLALVAAKENERTEANDYIQRAVALTPNSSYVYVRSAQVREAMGDYSGAVTDLLSAVVTDASDPKALPALVDLANSNYAAVNAGLTEAIDKNPRQPLFYFLRGSIAAAHFHYSEAIADFNYIIDENLYAVPAMYCTLAECYYALGKYDTALSKIEPALNDYGESDNVSQFYTVRARIYRAMGEDAKAKASIDRALDFAPDNSDAIVEKALVMTSLKEYKDASTLLGEVIMNEPYQPMNYILRAWILNDFLNQPKAAKGLYGRVIGLDLDHSENLPSMLGFAQLFDGKTAPAIAWMDAILAKPDYDGKNHYYGACFYSWAGKTDKALDCMEQALRNGYANYHDWMNNNDGRINVSPIRDTARFKELMKQYAAIFAI